MSGYKINLLKLIEGYNNSEGVRAEFKTLYNYVLYTCGGDFSLFEEAELREANIEINLE